MRRGLFNSVGRTRIVTQGGGAPAQVTPAPPVDPPAEGSGNAYINTVYGGATHYVAPYASVTGATSDMDTTNGTAYASATSSGSPCTIGEAAANGTLGDVIQMAGGTYIISGLDERVIPNLNPANSGISGSPIVFVAENPASFNSTGLTIFTASATTDAGPTFGAYQRDYIIWDGISADETGHPLNPDTALARFESADNCKIKNCDLTNITVSSNTNHSCIRTENCDGIEIYNNILVGSYDTSATGNSNVCSIETYGTSNLEIHHNDVSGSGGGIHVKGMPDPTIYNAPTTISVHHNHIFDGSVFGAGISIGYGNGIDVYQNLIHNCDTGIVVYDYANDIGGHSIYDLAIYNNTIMETQWQCIYDKKGEGSNTALGGTANAIRDNILEGGGNASGSVWYLGGDGYNSYNTLDYNYYILINAGTMSNSAGTFSAWQTLTGDEANSSETTPTFTDAANDDYTLVQNGQAALTASSTSGPIGCYITGSETIGVVDLS